VNREQVWKHVSDGLRADFGRLLEVRDVRRIRRVTGEAWVVTVVLTAPSGDLHVADLTIDGAGSTTPTLGPDDVIDAVRRAQATSVPPAALPDELADFGDEAATDDDLGLLEEIDEPIEARIDAARARGDEASLRTARDLLPRLLADHDRRGATLLAMAEIEVQLGEPALARGYLEAAAREFADRFDLPALEKAATLALDLVPREAFSGSPIHSLLEQSRARLKPLASLFDARSMSELPAELRARLEAKAKLRTLAPGETLVAEGDPSRNVFVVRSGLLGVWLEKPSGGSWLVRCCFPGWLLGESSVLAGPDARCTASLKAERISEVWVLPAADVGAVMAEDLAFGVRIAQTKQLHRLDSFFSMHETMSQLDAQVRDDMLSCFQRLESFESDTIVLPANAVPGAACLVAKGSLALYEDGAGAAPVSTVEPDSFYGVRDAIHAIASNVTAIASAGSTIAFFDADRLRKLCEASPESVVAVLERLG
jgi:CRP-like cAMP-binding protein